MASFVSRKLSSPWVAALLALALLGLAALQYRWIGEISRAERERLGRGLVSSASLLRRDFNRELQRVAEDFWIDPRGLDDPRAAVLERFVRRRSRPADLRVANVYVRAVDPEGDLRVERLNPDTLEFEAATLPPELAALSNIADRRRRGGGSPGGFGGLRPGAWTFLRPGILATSLVTVEYDAQEGRPRFRSAGGLYLQLDLEKLGEDTFPELVERYFDPEQFAQVAVLESESPDGRVLFRSTSPAESRPSLEDAEFVVPLLWNREESGRETADRLRDRFGRAAEDFFPPPDLDDRLPPPGPGADRRRRGRREGRGGERGRRSSGFDSFPAVANIGRSGPDGWMLVVSTADGTLDQLVARTRNRNLAVSFGVLLLLGAGLALVLASTRRAQRLAEMQMEFVAGVSHELRTPLAVIRSAGENLAEGVVDQPEQIREYGALVRDHGRRLSEMVDQTLELAGAQSGKRAVTLEAVDLAELLDEVEAHVEGASVEAKLPEDLPAAYADRAAIRLALRNLLENAQKYAGQSGPVVVEGAREGDRLKLRVRDEGPGIAPEDVTHLFEPFYRGRQAHAEQTRGAGLGLSLAYDAVEASGGRLTVESRLGQGSVFTIDLPGVPEAKA